MRERGQRIAAMQLQVIQLCEGADGLWDSSNSPAVAQIQTFQEGEAADTVRKGSKLLQPSRFIVRSAVSPLIPAGIPVRE